MSHVQLFLLPFVGRRRAVHVGREAAEALALAVVDARGGGGGAVPVVVAVGGLQIPGWVLPGIVEVGPHSGGLLPPQTEEN